MNKLSVDLDLLLELSLVETRGEGECYINLKDGEFSYIPQSIIAALKDQALFAALESWEKELAKEAEDIVMNYSDGYLYIPIISDEKLVECMKEFTSNLSRDEQNTIKDKVDFNNSFLNFNKVIATLNKLDNYYDFRDAYLKDFLVHWLKENSVLIK